MSTPTTLYDPSKEAESARGIVSDYFVGKADTYRQATAGCDEKGKNFNLWLAGFLFISCVVMFLILVTSKSTPTALQVIGYIWSIPFAAWSGFYLFSNLFGSKPVVPTSE